MLQQYYDIAIIGGGILGASLAYFISSSSSNSVILIEKEQAVALHASNRNTGKVHAPFLYDPIHKKLFAKAAYLGFQMLFDYCKSSSLPFRLDGVLSVATYDKGIDALHKYLEWGFKNGLQNNELFLLDNDSISKVEPNVKCMAALYCSRDGSVNYGAITRQLVHDASRFGCKVVTGSKVMKINREKSTSEIQYIDNKARIVIRWPAKKHSINTEYAISKNRPTDALTSRSENEVRSSVMTIHTNYVINAAGGNAVGIAHSMNAASEYTNLYFRGEYWQAPQEYQNLTKISIYSVPRYTEYPFLDPHWIVRFDGTNEVGPNAVPVFGPYSYDWRNNIRYSIPKILEIAKNSGIPKLLFNRDFMHMLAQEFRSSLSRTTMINRVREFLPILKPSLFKTRGTSGIRSLLVSNDGKFIPDMVEVKDENSLHVLNYNSPGATSALPISAMIVNQLLRDGILRPRKNGQSIRRIAEWDVGLIDSQMKSN